MLVKCLKVVLSLEKIKCFLQNLVSINEWLYKYFRKDTTEIMTYIILEPKKEQQKTHRNHWLQHLNHTEMEIEAQQNWMIYLIVVSGLNGARMSDSKTIISILFSLLISFAHTCSTNVWWLTWKISSSKCVVAKIPSFVALKHELDF